MVQIRCLEAMFVEFAAEASKDSKKSNIGELKTFMGIGNKFITSREFTFYKGLVLLKTIHICKNSY